MDCVLQSMLARLPTSQGALFKFTNSVKEKYRKNCVIGEICVAEKEEMMDFPTGIKQSGNAKITFKDEDYFIKVCCVQNVVSYFYLFSESFFLLLYTTRGFLQDSHIS